MLVINVITFIIRDFLVKRNSVYNIWSLNLNIKFKFLFAILYNLKRRSASDDLWETVNVEFSVCFICCLLLGSLFAWICREGSER